MSGSSLNYASINAKLKGMRAKKLKTKEEYFELYKQIDFKSAIIVLKNEFEILQDLNENSDRIEIEKSLDKITILDIKKIYRLLSESEKELFKIFISKFEANCLKSVIKNLTNNIDMNKKLENVELWAKYIFTNLDGIANVQSKEEFLLKSQNSIYYNVLNNYLSEKTLEEISLFEIETILDKYYFELLFKKTKKFNKTIENMVGSRIDLFNVLWIYRTKKYYKMTEQEVKNIIIDVNYKLSDFVIGELIKSKNFNEMKEILENTQYKNILTEDSQIEKDIQKYWYKMYKNIFQKGSYNISMPISYMYLEEIQKANIINILGGIIYNLDKTKIEEKIIV